MEVASPLTFQPSGTKRSFACSPPVGSTMDVSDDYSQHTKRRRFDSNTSPHATFHSAFHNSTNIHRSLALGGKSTEDRRHGASPKTRKTSKVPRNTVRYVTSWISDSYCPVRARSLLSSNYWPFSFLLLYLRRTPPPNRRIQEKPNWLWIRWDEQFGDWWPSSRDCFAQVG
jgi:hypothetical protein